MDVFLLQASASSGLAAGVVNGLGGDRMIRCMAESPREQPLGRLALESSPILAQCIQQLGAEHDVTILASLAPLDVDDHPLAINIADLQARQFGTPHTGSIERHQYDPMKMSQGRVDQTSDLLLTENDRQLQHFLGIGSFGHAPGSLEGLDVEEAQRRQPLVHRIRRQLPLLKQRGLVLADVLRAQLIGGTVEVPGEVFDGVNVTIDGGLSVVATLQFFEHDLAKMGHREILLISASHLRSAPSKLLAYDTRKRPPYHGFVQVLGLYRKRPLRGIMNHVGVFGRFRYSDLKEAAGYG